MLIFLLIFIDPRIIHRLRVILNNTYTLYNYYRNSSIPGLCTGCISFYSHYRFTIIFKIRRTQVYINAANLFSIPIRLQLLLQFIRSQDDTLSLCILANIRFTVSNQIPSHGGIHMLYIIFSYFIF